MASPRDPNVENIRALEDLKLAARGAPTPGEPPPQRRDPPPVPPRDEALFPEMPATRKYGPTPESPQRRPIPDRRPPIARRPPADPGTPQFHCLSCGYGLSAESAFRCSECGRQYDGGFLAAWFEGTEETRINYLIWLVTAALVLKGWSLFSITILPIAQVQSTCFDVLILLGSAACAIGACAWAGRDRMDTFGGYFAIAGMAAGGVMGVGALFGGLTDRSLFIRPSVLFAADALCGSLFLLALLQPVNGVELWRARPLRQFALPAAIALPPLALLLYVAETQIRKSAAVAAATGFNVIDIVNSTSLMACASFAIWIMARQWLVKFRRMVFLRPDDAEE